MKMQIEASPPPNKDKVEPESNLADPLGSSSGGHKRSEEFLQALIVMVAQAQDNIRLEDRERVEENEGAAFTCPLAAPH